VSVDSPTGTLLCGRIQFTGVVMMTRGKQVVEGNKRSDETCMRPVAPVYAGLLHGVSVFFGGRQAKDFPAGDEAGTERPRITVKPECGTEELFKAVCYVRGRYDLERELDGLEPFNWGPVGTYQDAYHVLGKQISTPTTLGELPQPCGDATGRLIEDHFNNTLEIFSKTRPSHRKQIKIIREFLEYGLPPEGISLCIMAFLHGVETYSPPQDDLPSLGALIERLEAIQDEHGPDLVVQVAGNDLDTISPVIWTAEEQAENGGALRDCLMLGGC